MGEQDRSDHATNVTETDANITAVGDIVDDKTPHPLSPDIVDRLRHMAWLAPEGEPYADALLEAADEIQRLRALCSDLHHDATCHKSFCRLCGEGVREWEVQRGNGRPLTAEQCAEWAQANVDSLGLLVKPQQNSTLRRFVAKLKKEARRG
jgi:hypothetical protein